MQETTPITPAEIDPKRRYLCRHVFTEGHRCGSPALRGQSLCYNHNRSRRDAGISGSSGTFPMPRIDDRASIQLALYEVLSRLAGGDIEYKRGSILLYGLQIASSNLPRRANTDAEQHPQVEEVTSDYDLGDLAPISPILTPEEQEEASLVELERTDPDRAKMKRKMKESLVAPRHPAPPATPEIRVPFTRAGHAARLASDLAAANLAAATVAAAKLAALTSPAAAAEPPLPSRPLILAAVQAVAALAETSNLVPCTRP